MRIFLAIMYVRILSFDPTPAISLWLTQKHRYIKQVRSDNDASEVDILGHGTIYDEFGALRPFS